MKIKYQTADTEFGGFYAEPSEYDGHPPLQALQLGMRPRTVSAHRLAAACALPFIEWTVNHLNSDGKLAPETARVIADYLENSELIFPHLSPAMFSYRIGTARLDVNAVALADAEVPNFAEADMTIDLLPGSDASGVLAAPHLRIMAGNANMFRALGSDFAYACCLLAIGILWAEEFHIGSIHLHPVDLTEKQQRFLEEYADSVALALRWKDSNA